MEIIKNQTIYQCSFCRRRFLSKNGAKIHENGYCKHGDSPHLKKLKKIQKHCGHANISTVYDYNLPGAEYEICIDCGERF